MKFKDIPQFPRAGYEVNVSWQYMEEWFTPPDRGLCLNLEPDYQRGHVWAEPQQVAYVEYVLMGGEMARILTTNCPGWMGDFRGPWELVDGLQRVTAVRRFMRGEIKAFGLKISEYEDRLGWGWGPDFRCRVLSLPTRKEVLRLYLLLNSGGVVHSPEEIARVKGLLAKEEA